MTNTPGYDQPDASRTPEAPHPAAQPTVQLPEAIQTPQAPVAPEILDGPQTPEAPQAPVYTQASVQHPAVPQATPHQSVQHQPMQQPATPQPAHYTPAVASQAEPVLTAATVAASSEAHLPQHHGVPQGFAGGAAPVAPQVQPDGAGGGSGFGPAVPVSGAGDTAHPKTRTSALLAGLAIGALLGGVVGGGVAAVVASNLNSQNVAQGSSTGTITLNNADNATAISGVAAVATPSVVTLEVSSASASGSGSGVIYSEDGYIVTNAHVVTLDGAALNDAAIRVKTSDGRILDGQVVGVDPYADLAVVKVDATGLPAITVADSNQLDVGDLTVAIGAPLNLANTVTSGVVSALSRGISVGSPLLENDQSQQDENSDDGGGSNSFPWDFRFGLPDENSGQQQQQQQSTGGSVTLPVIQTDASINPGNSGGALLNGQGELIGINVAIASTSTSSGTAGSVGLGFAIPSNLAARVADALIAGEQPSHGLLGASVADSSQDTDADANFAGGLLVEVTPGGAAEAAGLKAGDVITAVDGTAAVDGTSVSALIRMHEGGSTVSIDYTRNGKAGQTDAKLGTLEW